MKKLDNVIQRVYHNAYEWEKCVEARIELTAKCNLNCIHCYIPKQNSNSIPYTKVIKVLDELREMGVYELCLTGGEIFLRDDIFEIIAYARKLGFSVTIMSNITLLDEKKIEKLSELYIKKVSCSIFSLDEDVNDKIMGGKHTLRKILNNIELLNKKQVAVEVKTVLMRENANEYRRIVEYCKKKNLATIISPVLTEEKSKMDNGDGHRILGEELEDIISDKTLHLYQANGWNGESYACDRIRYSIFISSDGGVFPCDTFSDACGNIYSSDIETIWNNSNQLRRIRNIKLNDLKMCAACNVNRFCYRCPGSAQAEDGDCFGKSTLACIHARARYKLYKEGRI